MSTITLFAAESTEISSVQPEYDLVFVRAQKSYFNDVVRVKGFVTLNDVREALGFNANAHGLCLGWVSGELVEINYDMESRKIEIKGFSDLRDKIA